MFTTIMVVVVIITMSTVFIPTTVLSAVPMFILVSIIVLAITYIRYITVRPNRNAYWYKAARVTIGHR